MTDQEPPLQKPPAPIRWQSWPLRENTLRAALVMVALLVGAIVVRWFSGRPYLTLLALAAMLISLWRFFLPVVFELNGDGVSQWFFRRQRRIPWRAVDHYEICSAGVLLFPHQDRSAMAAFRGLFIPWTTHRDEVLAHVQHYLGRPETG